MSEYGKDTNFFQKITVSSATYTTDSDITLNIRGGISNFTLVNEGTNVVFYSFNSFRDHGDMTPSSTTAAIAFDNRSVGKIWFRSVGGSSVVRFEGWA